MQLPGYEPHYLTTHVGIPSVAGCKWSMYIGAAYPLPLPRVFVLRIEFMCLKFRFAQFALKLESVCVWGGGQRGLLQVLKEGKYKESKAHYG